jgi:hypothetical protein
VTRIGRSLILLGASCFLVASGRSTRATLPPIPPLPSAGWPSPEDAEPFARRLMASLPADDLDTIAAGDPSLVPKIFRNLGTALLSRDAALQNAVKAYATSLAQTHAAHMRSTFSQDDLQTLIAFQVLDPLRYANDEEFRRAIDSILPRSLMPSLPEALRRAAVNELDRVAPISFETSEALAMSAGLLARSSAQQFSSATTARIVTTGSEKIEASIYSITSRFVKPDEAKRFLSAVRVAAPLRRIIVMGDDTMRSALSKEIALHIDFIDNLNRPLTPWPRDPFSVGRTANGSVVFINRPNQQRNREEDATMVRVLIDGLPKPLEERWKARWTTGATSFHNGQVLLTPKAAWISIHSVEFRAVELLGLERIPVEQFGSAQGVARYVGAVQRAASELSQLYGRPVRFIHQLPRTPDEIEELGGGAGFDLDSIVTLLPHGDGSTEALVGDLSLGRKLAAAAPAGERQELKKTYGLNSASLIDDASAARLQRFLDRCADDLAANGMRVRRLPLLMIASPPAGDAETPYFLVTWNNVVLEHDRAEGFASGLASGDRAAKTAFKAAGYELLLFPTLPRSVILNGGYRCASNEVRAAR